MAYATMKQALGTALVAAGERDGNVVVLDADLQRVTETEAFMKRFPKRHFNLGIAEANMVGVALGIALSGKTVFCGTFACFATQRVADQAAIMAHCEANVKIIGMEAALSAGSNGATHQGMLDLAIEGSLVAVRRKLPLKSRADQKFLRWYQKEFLKELGGA